LLEQLEERSLLTAVAVLGADESSYIADVQAKVASTGLFSSVTAIEARYTTPRLAELEDYDSVLVWSNYGFQDSTTLGNNLADYVDAGHGVVVATFTNSEVPLGGRWASDGYDAIAPGGSTSGQPFTLGTVVQPSHPIMAGVTSFSGGSSSYHSTGSLTGGASLIASWSNDDILVAEKDTFAGRDVSLNFFPPSSDVSSGFWTSSTQGALLMGNALNYAGGFIVTGSVPARGEIIASPPTDFVIDLGDAYDPASVDAGDLTVNGILADSVDMTTDATLTFHYLVSPVTSQGVQSMHMDEGSVASLEDGELLNEFNASFRYDTVRLAVSLTDSADGSVVELPLTTLRVHFNEAVDSASVDVSDLTVGQGTITAATPVLGDPTAVDYTIAGLNHEGALNLNIAAGALTDPYGNPGLAYTGSLSLDFGTVPYPLPLVTKEPLGSLIYDPSITGKINASGDTDTFTLNLDANQTVTVVVEPIKLPSVVQWKVSDGGNGHYYLLTNSELTWPEAENYAQSLGGHLASITSSAENDFVRTNFASSEFWIGANDAAVEGDFQWSSGEPFSYSNWWFGEPNDSGGIEDYALINFVESGRWNDGADGVTRRGIVELPAEAISTDFQPTSVSSLAVHVETDLWTPTSTYRSLRNDL
jgi:hypothetical protein